MQYHNMLKQKHETEQKAAGEQAAKRTAIEDKVNAHKKAEQAEVNKVTDAERAAADLVKQESRDKESKNAFAGGGVKKGILETKKKKK